jgi:hypothetical protein
MGTKGPVCKRFRIRAQVLRRCGAQWDSLIVENGLLKRAWESVDGKAAGSAQVPSEGGPARNPW